MSGKRGAWYWSRGLGAVLLLVVVVAAAERRAALQGVGTDFHVFWQAGYDFARGPRCAEDVQPYEFAYLPSLHGAAPLLYPVLTLVVLAAFLAHIIRLRPAHQPVGALEISSVFLTSHLLSGISFKAHLVTLLFVFYAFFALDPKRGGRVGRWALGLAWSGIVVIGLGRDMIGSRLHHYLAGTASSCG